MRFRTLFLVFLLAELVSYAAYFFPALNAVGFFVLIAAALALSLRRLEYGLGFVLADLILGGKSGMLFSFEYGGFILSLRMALFIVVMAIWLAKVLFYVRLQKLTIVSFCNQSLLKWWGVLGVAVVWGIIVGLARGNNFGNLFLDANGYFYAALVLPVWWVLLGANYESVANLRISNSQIRKFEPHSKFAPLTAIFLAATTLLALKTLFAVYWFTHAGNIFIGANLIPFYRWVRDTGIGEITTLPGNFARVFFQSHIYNVAAFFVVLTTFITPPTSPYLRRPAGSESDRSVGLKGRKLIVWALLVLNTSVIIVSLSRSFWVGTIVGIIVLFALMWRTFFKKELGTLVFAVIIALGLLLAVSRFPFPRPSPASFSEAVQSRLEAGDAGQSRWNLLPPLFNAASGHAIIGHGFGKTITYISNDPRIREVSRTGEYTTSAFEWGWLDLWLKMGVLGIIGFAGLIVSIARLLYRRGKGDSLSLGGLATLVALAAIHFFTPYLNHPLGIGLLIVLTYTGLPCQVKPDVIR